MKMLPIVKSVDGHMGGVESEQETTFLRNQNESFDHLWCLGDLRS